MRVRRLILLLALAILVEGAPARGEDFYSQEKCSLCHIRQSVFFSPGFASAETLKSFGEERVCYSCHNAAVVDSRGVLWRGAQHPAVASGAGSEGRRCSSCHSPHAKGGWAVLAGTSTSIRKGGDAVCAKCHAGYQRTEGVLHRSRFPEGGCAECHRAHGGTGSALLREPRSTLCLRCHADADGKSGGHAVLRPAAAARAGRPLPECLDCHPVHRKGQAGDVIGGQCAGCHQFAKGRRDGGAKAHPSEGNCTACHSFHKKAADGGRGFRGRDMRSARLCGGCHGPKVADSRAKGREVGTHPTQTADGKEDICLRCHRIHGGAPGTALLATPKSYSCLECHGGQNTISEIAGIVLAHPVFERVAGGRLTGSAAGRRLNLGTSGEIVCRTCHSVHGAAAGTPLLAQGMSGDGSCVLCHEKMGGMNHLPSGKAAGAPGCETCHPVHGKRPAADAGNPWAAVCTACHAQGSSHVSGGSGGVSHRPGDMPGFDGRGRRLRTGAIACPTCHVPHGQPLNRRLRRAYASTGFVCTACHRDKETIALTPHDLRGIAGASVCEPCHKPHGGKPPWMWGLPAGEGDGVSAACRSCHRDQGLGKRVPPGGHPVNVVVPRPISETFPLFGASGEKARSGVMTCGTCHEVHGTGFVPNGQGPGMLLRSEAGQAAEDLGRIRTCLPCHQGKQATHGQADCIWCHPPHEEAKTGPDCGTCHVMREQGISRTHAERRQGCGACHRIHGTKETASVEAACLGCHPKSGRVVGTPHGQMEGGPCRECHPAHESLELKPVKRHQWDDPFPPDFPCLRCHRDDGKGPAVEWGDHPKSRKKVPTSYGAVVTLETPIVMLGRLQEGGAPLFPLFDESGNKALSGRMGCVTCHDPHAGNRAKGEGDQPPGVRYLRDPSGAFLAEICVPCHRNAAGNQARQFHDLPRKTE